MSNVQSITTRSWQQRHDGTEYSFRDTEELLAFIQHEIHASRQKYNAIAAKAGCCASTVSKLAAGETRFPRASTVFAVLRTLGFTIVVKS